MKLEEHAKRLASKGNTDVAEFIHSLIRELEDRGERTDQRIAQSLARYDSIAGTLPADPALRKKKVEEEVVPGRRLRPVEAFKTDID